MVNFPRSRLVRLPITLSALMLVSGCVLPNEVNETESVAETVASEHTTIANEPKTVANKRKQHENQKAQDDAAKEVDEASDAQKETPVDNETGGCDVRCCTCPSGS
jgi:outer membrane murein-binding lipoprotein Lpp